MLLCIIALLKRYSAGKLIIFENIVNDEWIASILCKYSDYKHILS